jgi:hypothetical protein
MDLQLCASLDHHLSQNRVVSAQSDRSTVIYDSVWMMKYSIQDTYFREMAAAQL